VTRDQRPTKFSGLHVRYYRGARTAHLERLPHMHPGLFVYRKPMYDFDTSEIAPEVLKRAPGVSRAA
jgi:hypothetical protein